MLYYYGLSLGLRSLLRGHLSKKTFALLVMPVNYWRVVEYAMIMKELHPAADDVILDIGSPKLFSMYLAETYGMEIHPTDIESYFLDEYRFHASLFKDAVRERIHPSIQDGRKLTFADSSFDKVYSISVVEHIPDCGDSQCLREIARVLRPGGRAILTIPFAPKGREEFSNGDFYWAGSSKKVDGNKMFFQHRYCESDIHERLVNPSGLNLVKLEYVGEKVLVKSEKEVGSYLPYALGPLHPLLSRLVLTEPTPDWKSLEKPLCALVVLEKKRP